MPSEQLEHAGTRYAVQFTYALPDDAWYVELSEAVPAPAAWADIPHAAEAHLPGPAFAGLRLSVHCNPSRKLRRFESFTRHKAYKRPLTSYKPVRGRCRLSGGVRHRPGGQRRFTGISRYEINGAGPWWPECPFATRGGRGEPQVRWSGRLTVQVSREVVRMTSNAENRPDYPRGPHVSVAELEASMMIKVRAYGAALKR